MNSYELEVSEALCALWCIAAVQLHQAGNTGLGYSAGVMAGASALGVIVYVIRRFGA
jgi:hypothetical protein